MNASTSSKGKWANFEIYDGCIHIIFETEEDAIEMMPKGPSVFERQGNAIVMIPYHPLAKQLKQDMYHTEA